MEDKTKESFDDLTPREKEVLNLISKGLTTRQISQILYISVPTVKTHRHNLLRKLRASNSVELISIALKKALI
jgi:DNA-binding CsgD family transcriptional regulator